LKNSAHKSQTSPKKFCLKVNQLHPDHLNDQEFKLDNFHPSKKIMKTKNPLLNGLIGRTDSARKSRLLDLCNFIRSPKDSTITLHWPDWHDQQRDLNDSLSLDQGPKTILPLSEQIEIHSDLVRAGVPMISETSFQSLVMPTLNRSLQATWGGSSVDLGNEGITVALSEPKRLSAFVRISDELTAQNPLMTGVHVESEILQAVGRALDHAAIAGSGVGEEPTGILSDLDVLSHTRASAGVDSLADTANMKKAIADANGEYDEEDYIFIADTGTRATLETTAGINGPIWGKPGPLGHQGIASTHAPSGTLALLQKSAVAFLDFNKLTVERLTNREEALAGIRTLLVTAFYDFAILDTNGVIVATDPA
jgi:hypothetical protein